MKRFINLSPGESTDLDKVIYKNALQLKKDALLLASVGKSYARATSLLILSSEEIIKATLVFLHSKNYKVYELHGAKRFFSDHKIRHHIAQFMEMGNAFLVAINKWDKGKRKRKKIGSNLINLIYLIDAGLPILKSKSNIHKIQQFDLLKNQGLYVDFMNDISIPQEIVTEGHFQETKNLITRIYKFYKVIKILHHPSLSKHLPHNTIVKHQGDLRFLINNVLKDFSFNSL